MSKFVRMFNSNTNDLSRIMNSYKLPRDRQGVGLIMKRKKKLLHQLELCLFLLQTE